MEEKRKTSRWRSAEYGRDETQYVKKYFKVYDRITDKSLGYMIDISSEGMKILSRIFIHENTAYKIRVELPEEVKGSDQLLVDVRSVWCERDPESERYRAGFAFVSTFPHHEEIIQLLFDQTDEREMETPEPVEMTMPEEL